MITIALLLSLLFGKPRLRSSPNFGNQEVHQRLIDDREFNSLDENDQQVILAKRGWNPITPPTKDHGPSCFPTPPSGGRPSRPVSGVNPYRVPPKVVNQGQGLGAGANPAGTGGGDGAAEFDDNSPVPNKEQDQKLLIMIIVQMIQKIKKIRGSMSN